jgi:hypothetical protein
VDKEISNLMFYFRLTFLSTFKINSSPTTIIHVQLFYCRDTDDILFSSECCAASCASANVDKEFYCAIECEKIDSVRKD